MQLAEAKEWDNSPAVMLIFLKAKKELLQEKEALSKLLKNIAGEEVPENMVFFTGCIRVCGGTFTGQKL